MGGFYRESVISARFGRLREPSDAPRLERAPGGLTLRGRA